MPILRWDAIELPEAPLDAAADFYARNLPEIRGDSEIHSEHDIALIFAPASHAHRAWRVAAVQELAREIAPRRVNGIVGADEDAIAQTVAYLESAHGVTGQLLELAAD